VVDRLRVLRAVAWVTFLEIVRDKILYNIVVLAFLLLGISFLASRLSFVRPDRLMLDFGLTAIELSCGMIASLVGAAMVAREFERRTIYVALSRPVSRMQYVTGKFLGLAGVVAINWLLLVCLHILVVRAFSVGDFNLIGPTYLAAVLLLLVESLALGALAVLFSTFSTTSLAVMFTLGFYFVGNNLSQLRLMAAKSDNAIGAVLLRGVALVLPDFEMLKLGEKVTYRLPVSAGYVLTGCAYGLFLIAGALVLSGIFVQSKEA
jgi:Cu-processing system permease protein